MADGEGVAGASNIHGKVVCPGFVAGHGAGGDYMGVVVTLGFEDFMLFFLGTCGRLPIAKSLVAFVGGCEGNSLECGAITDGEKYVKADLTALQNRVAFG